MASQGFWSLGGDNAGANPGSQSPSTREWLFLVFKRKKKKKQLWRTHSSALSHSSALDLASVFYNRHICFFNLCFLAFFFCRDVTICVVFYLQLAWRFSQPILKLDAAHPLFWFISPSSSQSLVPSGGPEILRRNWIEIMWYVAAHGERGWGWDGVELGWVGTCIPPLTTSLFVARVLRNVSLSLFFGRPKALLNVGEVEKPADPAAKQPPQREAAGTCGCNKSCNCTKGPVVFSDLYSTGTRANGSHNTPWSFPLSLSLALSCVVLIYFA